jgi:hypothetical protein
MSMPATEQSTLIIPGNLLIAELPGQPIFTQLDQKKKKKKHPSCKRKKGLFTCKEKLQQQATHPIW